MKKLLTLTATCAILTAPASAVQKCVALDVGASCRADSVDSGGIYWDMTCNPETSNPVYVGGIGVCAQDLGYGDYDVLSDDEFRVVSTDATSVNLKSCWCRVLTPFVSKWILSYTYTASLQCAKYCAQQCAGDIEMGILMDEILVGAI